MGLAAVADAGPLIHLSEIGGLDLLGQFEPLYVPEAVWEESCRHAGENLKALQGNFLLQAISEEREKSFSRTHSLKGLQRGERAALYLCSSLGIEIVLTDDLAARRAAERLGIRAVGSLGIVARGFRLGMVTFAQAETLLWGLYRVSSLFVTAAIVELALDELRQKQVDG
jgi:predicted nucleic acid-binding protein